MNGQGIRCSRSGLSVTTMLSHLFLNLPRDARAFNAWEEDGQAVINLPDVERGEEGSFSDLMYQRRSMRNSGEGKLDLDQVTRLLFAAQGITREGRFRTVPSAGALYPLEIFLVAGSIEDLEEGVYRYSPEKHQLRQVCKGDNREDLAREAYRQMWVSEAPVILVISAVYERVAQEYGERGRRHAHIEAGCAAQNISLEGYHLGLGSTVVGAFSDTGVAKVIKAEKNEKPLVVMPVGPLLHDGESSRGTSTDSQ